VSVYSAGGSQLTQVGVSVTSTLTFTYAHWVKLTALPSAFQGTYIASATDGAVGHGILGVGLSTASGWECAIGQATTNAGCAATADRAGGWVTNEWVCLAVTFAPSLGARMYVGYLNQPMQEVTYQAGHAGGGLGSGNVNVPAGSPQLYWGSFLSAGAASLPAHHHTFGYWTRVLDLREMRQFQAGIVPPGAYAVVTPRGTEPAPVDRSGNKRAVSYVSGATIRQGENFPLQFETVADDEWTSTASGIVALSAPASRTATANGTFSALTGSAAASLTIRATGAATFPAPTGSAAGSVALSAAGSGTFAAPVGAATGSLPLSGVASGTFPAPTGAAVGALTVTATASGSFAAPTGVAAASLSVTAAGAGSFAGLSGAATGSLPLTAAASGTFATLSGSATGSLSNTLSAVGDGTFAVLTGSATATLTLIAAAAGAFGALTGSATASLSTGATASGAFATLTGGAAGTLTIRAAAAGTFAQLIGAGAATTGGAAVTLALAARPLVVRGALGATGVTARAPLASQPLTARAPLATSRLSVDPSEP
jgi:hypothetical protein